MNSFPITRGRYEITPNSSRRVIAWTTAGGWEDRNGVVEPYSEERLELDKNYWQPFAEMGRDNWGGLAL